MKILALRGENLASLSAPFALEFQSPAWQQQGLFAITGRTGAGKSTLLDALCLALYARMPRLDRAVSVTVEGVGANDPRTIITRGASHAWAECEFMGNDGLPYRSRWSVRRARGRAKGRLQADEMQAWCLAHTPPRALGRTKTEVLRALVLALGLSFEQFRRAVLLAQGDFAAFLHAPADERATLLERLTGTEAYSRVSIAAFEQAKIARAQCDALQANLGQEMPLGEVERAALVAELAQASKACDQAQQAWQAAAQTVQNAQTKAALQQAFLEAKQAYTDACQAQAVHAAQHPDLARYCAVQAARPAWEVWRQTQRRLQEQSLVQTRLAQQVALATQAYQTAQGVQTQAQAAYDAELAVQRSAQLQWQQAHRLEAEMQVLQQHHQALLEQQQRHTRALTSDQQQIRTLTQRLQQAQNQLSTLALEQQRQNVWAPLAENWEHWFTHLRQQAQWLQSDRQQEKIEQQQQAAYREQAQTLSEQQQTLDSYTQQLRHTQENYQRARAHQRAAPLAALYAEREQLQQAIHQLNQYHQSWQQLQELEQLIHAQQAEVTSATEAIRTAQNNIAHHAQTYEVQQALYEMAERTLDQVMMAANPHVAELRQQLTPEQACPVCGSTDHPWANTATAALEGLYQQQRTQAQELRQAVECTQALLQKNMVLRDQSQRHQQYLTQQLTQAQQQQQTLRASLGHHADPVWNETLYASELAKLEQKMHGLNLPIQQAEWAHQQLERAQQQHEDMLQRVQMAQQYCQGNQKKTAELQTQWQKTQAQRHALQAQLQANAQRLEPVLAPSLGQWQDVLRQDTNGFFKACTQQVEHYLDLQEQQQTLTESLTQSQQQLQTLQARLQPAQEALQRLDTQVKDAQIALQTLHDEWEQLTGGLSVSELIAAQEAKLNRLQQQCQQADGQVQHTSQQWHDAQRQVDQINGEKRMLTEHSVYTQARWEAVCEQLGMSTDGVAQDLHLDPQQIEQWQQEAEDLAQTVARCNQHCETRAHDLAAQPATLPLEAAQAALQQAQAHVAATQAVYTNLQRAVAQDDARCAAHAARLPSLLAAQNQLQRWEQLRDLLGSADGKKLRSFVQGLTLDVLLAHSNQHLQQLTARYRLQRVAHTLELQVCDRVFGDEMRSIHSVSGGETFILALALALGLASLSAEKVVVESLFIDEGFGALDHQTLDGVLAALENLQASGRRVGIISHVPALMERIAWQVQVVGDGHGHSRVVVPEQVAV